MDTYVGFGFGDESPNLGNKVKTMKIKGFRVRKKAALKKTKFGKKIMVQEEVEI